MTSTRLMCVFFFISLHFIYEMKCAFFPSANFSHGLSLISPIRAIILISNEKKKKKKKKWEKPKCCVDFIIAREKNLSNCRSALNTWLLFNKLSCRSCRRLLLCTRLNDEIVYENRSISIFTFYFYRYKSIGVAHQKLVQSEPMGFVKRKIKTIEQHGIECATGISNQMPPFDVQRLCKQTVI